MQEGMNQERFEHIIALYKRGQTIQSICLDPSSPSYDAFYEWVHNRPEAIAEFRASQKEHAAAAFDAILHIADTDPDPKRARNRMFARNLVASRYDRDRFGEKAVSAIEHTINITHSVEQARQRMINVTPQPVEIQQITPPVTSDITSDVDDAAERGIGIFS